ncbi:hypothetical protein QCA50_012688 [Cerrena zonata]|uniref:Uncharacterized protein n=1 Tax=Cerrena zonata TaxID=2478898 RepID=A0AAW0G341_9APHY
MLQVGRRMHRYGVRYASTGGEPKSPLFLTNLLNRIDEINATSKRIMTEQKPKTERKQAQTGQAQRGQTGQAQRGQTGQAQRGQTGQAQRGQTGQAQRGQTGQAQRGQAQRGQRGQAQRNEKEEPFQLRRFSPRVKVKDHPLAMNTFQVMSEHSTENRRPQAKARTRSNPRNFSLQKRSKPKPRSKPVAKQSIGSKQLISKPLEPKITSAHFIQGHPASLITNKPSTGLVSVIKETLIKSNYPYKLPKSIIDGINPNFQGNKYILQKNWQTKFINPDTLSERLNEVVKEGLKTAHSIQHELMKNGSMSLSSKQLILNVSSGIISPRELLADAHWNRK